MIPKLIAQFFNFDLDLKFILERVDEANIEIDPILFGLACVLAFLPSIMLISAYHKSKKTDQPLKEFKQLVLDRAFVDHAKLQPALITPAFFCLVIHFAYGETLDFLFKEGNEVLEVVVFYWPSGALLHFLLYFVLIGKLKNTEVQKMHKGAPVANLSRLSAKEIWGWAIALTWYSWMICSALSIVFLLLRLAS